LTEREKNGKIMEKRGGKMKDSEKERFARSCLRIVGREYERGSVGVLKEKTMHAVLKDFIEPDPSFHEQKVEGYVADIVREGEIYEIQTRSLDKLSHKLAAFLPSYRVTVIHPIPAAKYIAWIDENGSISPLRCVRKNGRFFESGRELERILPFLSHPNLSVRLLLIDMEEYRLLNGWGNGGKRGSERYDRIPLGLVDELFLTDAESFSALLPEGLSSPFTAKEFRKAVHGGPKCAPALLKVLCAMGQAERCGKRGNAFLYTRVAKSKEDRQAGEICKKG
jgi:hypothetical protein